MVNFILALGAFFLEWFLAWAFIVVLYAFFSKYLVTRYLIAYPGLILLFNVLGWLLSYCIFFFYTIGGIFHSSFIDYKPFHENPSQTDKYIGFLESCLRVSTVVMTACALFFIYGQEREHWQSGKQKGANP